MFRVDLDLTVKVGGFVLAQSNQNQTPYFQKSPAKWMSPEILMDGICTEKTVVVGCNKWLLLMDVAFLYNIHRHSLFGTLPCINPSGMFQCMTKDKLSIWDRFHKRGLKSHLHIASYAYISMQVLHLY